MKIILLKNHNGSKARSEHDITTEAANYLVRCGVAEYAESIKAEPVKQVKPKAAPKQTKQVKPKLEKK